MSAEELSSFERAEGYLISALKQNKQYKNWSCIFFMEDGSKEDAFLIAVREKHDAECGGDPDIAPILDRYKVSKKGLVFKYDPLDDEYKRYFLNNRGEVSKDED